MIDSECFVARRKASARRDLSEGLGAHTQCRGGLPDDMDLVGWTDRRSRAQPYRNNPREPPVCRCGGLEPRNDPPVVRCRVSEPFVSDADQGTVIHPNDDADVETQEAVRLDHCEVIATWQNLSVSKGA